MQQTHWVLIIFPAFAVTFLLLAWRLKSGPKAGTQGRTYMRLGLIFSVISLVLVVQRYFL